MGSARRGTLQKLYYIGPQFRRERPQKGRYRQFYQIGAEIIGPPTAGSESPARDAEVLEMLATLLDEVGLRGWKLAVEFRRLRRGSRALQQGAARGAAAVVHQMCADCQRRAETNPLRVLDCKVPEDQPIIEKLPKISRVSRRAVPRAFRRGARNAGRRRRSYTINERMVRGLDYYTRTTFEFTHGGLGAQNAVLGGGRYDGLSESLGGPKAPGHRLRDWRRPSDARAAITRRAAGRKIQAFVAPLGAGMNNHALKLARELRRAGVEADLGDENFRLKKSFELAEKAGAQYIVIVGENEVAADQFAVKNLASGEQVTVARADLSAYLRK